MRGFFFFFLKEEGKEGPKMSNFLTSNKRAILSHVYDLEGMCLNIKIWGHISKYMRFGEYVTKNPSVFL